MVRAIGVILLGLMTFTASAQRILGYFPDYRSEGSIQYDKLTDIGFAFLNPNSNGTLAIPGSGILYSFNSNLFAQVKSNAAGKCDLWITIGGADDGHERAARLKSVCSNSSARATFVSELVQFGVDNSLAGIIVDWEFPTDATARTGHENLLRDLNIAIAASARPTMKIACAVGGETVITQFSDTHVDFMNANAYQYVDEFHIMAYDFPNNNLNYDSQHHSSETDALRALDGWNAAGVPYDKMLLAIPFYARASNNRDLLLQYNDMTSGDQNAIYMSDSYNGYNYNGYVTLQSKTSGAMAKGALGVVIWDIGQDKSSPYSLLDKVKEQMDIECTLPVPSLGTDIGICGTVNEVLNSGLSSTAGLSVQWYRNDALINGESGTTYTATDNGVYKIVIQDQSGTGCSRESSMEIVSGSAISATGGTGCASTDITLSVNNPDGATTYEWFDAENGGTNVGTGSTVTVDPATTTSYWVEEQSTSANYVLGNVTMDGLNDMPWAWAQKMGEVAHMIHAEQSLTITSVKVKMGGEGVVKIVIFDEFGARVDSSDEVSFQSGTKAHWSGGSAEDWQPIDVTIPAGITLGAGSYFISVTGTDAGATVSYPDWQGNDVTVGARVYCERYICNTDESGGGCTDRTIPTDQADIFGSTVDAFVEPGVVAMEALANIGWYAAAYEPAPNQIGLIDISQLQEARLQSAREKLYGVLFDIRIETGASSSCPRAEAVAITEDCTPLSLVINSPTDGSSADLADNPISIDVTTDGTVESVIYEITGPDNFSDQVSGSAANGYDLDYTFPGAGVFTITVTASNSIPEEVTDNVSIQITAIGFAELFENAGIELFPNPSTSEFNITAEDLTTGYTINVYRSNGSLVETTSTTGTDLSFGQGLETGVYTVELVTESHVYSSKIVKN